jgi:hypothetical protein
MEIMMSLIYITFSKASLASSMPRFRFGLIFCTIDPLLDPFAQLCCLWVSRLFSAVVGFRFATSCFFTRTSAVLDRFCFDLGVWSVALYLDFGDLGFGEAFDAIEKLSFIDTDQRDSLSVGACTPCTSNAMDIVLWDIGELIFDHMRELIDIDPSCCDIGSDEYPNLSCFEPC